MQQLQQSMQKLQQSAAAATEHAAAATEHATAATEYSQISQGIWNEIDICVCRVYRALIHWHTLNMNKLAGGNHNITLDPFRRPEYKARLYQGSMKALLRLFYGALLRRY